MNSDIPLGRQISYMQIISNEICVFIAFLQIKYSYAQICSFSHLVIQTRQFLLCPHTTPCASERRNASTTERGRHEQKNS